MSPLRLHLLIAVVAVLTLPAAAEERQTQSPSEQPPAESTEKAPQPAASSPTMKELLSDGYEVRTTSVIPHDIVMRGGSTADVDAAMIILQKGSAVATCYTEFASFANGAFVTLPCNVYK